jgi:hypothetical protein
MSIDPGNERIRRMNRKAELERGPDDPNQPAKPRDANRFLIIVLAALLIGVALLGWMHFSNSKYDGSSPAPIAEHR